MNQFYVSIIFLGILLIFTAIVMIAYDRKRAYDHSKQLDEKKNELSGIIQDAENMIDELNRFSDYVVTQMDLKNEELNSILKTAEEKIKNLSVRAQREETAKSVRTDTAVSSARMAVNASPVPQLFNFNSEIAIENIGLDSSTGNVVEKANQAGKPKEGKVIPLNSKHKEVLILSAQGLDDTEIAKRLNMGKGEIQLILGVNR